MGKWFWSARARAIWYLLTRRYFVVMSCVDEHGKDMMAQHSVNAEGFYIMARRCGPAIDRNEGQADVMRQVNEILGQNG